MSLGKVESELKTCPIVENICIYGDPTKQFTVALVVPNHKHLEELAERNSLKTKAFEELCTSPVMEKAVLKELAEHARKCKCLESVSNVTVVQLITFSQANYKSMKCPQCSRSARRFGHRTWVSLRPLSSWNARKYKKDTKRISSACTRHESQSTEWWRRRAKLKITVHFSGQWRCKQVVS